VRIVKRVEPCRCGCTGKDPWHQRAYKRVVRDMRPCEGKTRTTAFGEVETLREGWAKFPWGKSRVVEIALTEFCYDEAAGVAEFRPVFRSDGTRASGGWAVDDDSWLDSQNAKIEGTGYEPALRTETE
jgi:hypothetical protein